jgi:hypothetical protein
VFKERKPEEGFAMCFLSLCLVYYTLNHGKGVGAASAAAASPLEETAVIFDSTR